MNANTVYCVDLVKWEGSKAARPFSVMWDDPESGADLKVVYRTPKLEGAIMLAIGLTALDFALFCFRICLQGAEYGVWVGFALIFAFGAGVMVCALCPSQRQSSQIPHAFRGRDLPNGLSQPLLDLPGTMHFHANGRGVNKTFDTPPHLRVTRNKHGRGDLRL